MSRINGSRSRRAAGLVDEILPRLEAACAAEPLRECRWALSMRALTEAGRPAEALTRTAGFVRRYARSWVSARLLRCRTCTRPFYRQEPALGVDGTTTSRPPPRRQRAGPLLIGELDQRWTPPQAQRLLEAAASASASPSTDGGELLESVSVDAHGRRVQLVAVWVGTDRHELAELRDAGLGRPASRFQRLTDQIASHIESNDVGAVARAANNATIPRRFGPRTGTFAPSISSSSGPRTLTTGTSISPRPAPTVVTTVPLPRHSARDTRPSRCPSKPSGPPR